MINSGILYNFIYYQYICVTSSMLGDVVYIESVKCVKIYFYSLLNISKEILKRSTSQLLFDLLSKFFLYIRKMVF